MIRPAPPRSVSSSRKVFTSGSSIMTIRTVVHDMVAVFRPVAGVQDIEFDKPRLARLAEQRRIQRGCKPFREQSQYINSHCFVLYEDWGRGEKPF